MTRLLPALVVLLAGCESTCEPGPALINGLSVFSRAISESQPLTVTQFRGACDEQELPTPTIRATDAAGKSVEGTLSGRRWSSSGASVDISIIFWELVTGWVDVTLTYPGGSRSVRMYVGAPVAAGSAVARVDGRCRPPVRVADGRTVCNQFGTEQGTINVTEQSETERFALPAHSKLFETSGDFLITSLEGIGWLRAGQRLSTWQPVLPFGSEAQAVASDAAYVYVFAGDRVRVFEKDLSRELPSLTPQISIDGARKLAANDDVLAVGSETGGSLELFRRVGASWTSLGVQPEPRRFIAASDDGVWTCSDTEVQWNELTPTALVPRQSLELFDECRVGSTQRPRLIAGNNPFMACPYRTADGIKFVEIDAPSRSGECFDHHAVLDYPSAGTFIFDLSAGLR